METTPATSLKVPLRETLDLVVARSAIQRMAQEIGFRTAAQIQIATAVSEICRNVLLYAGSGEMNARRTSRGISIEVWDQGPGIPLETLAEIDSGSYKSRTGLGKGITGARNLMDSFSIISLPGSTQILMEKFIDG